MRSEAIRKAQQLRVAADMKTFLMLIPTPAESDCLTGDPGVRIDPAPCQLAPSTTANHFVPQLQS
jgi:hypothetical protein